MGPPLDLSCPFPSGGDHHLQIQVGPPTPKRSRVHPNDGGPSGLEELREVTWSARLLQVGDLQPPSWESPYL